MRTSGPGSATMFAVPAGVAQLAEQPSCKRQVSGSNPLTGSQVREVLALCCLGSWNECYSPELFNSAPRRNGHRSRVRTVQLSQAISNHLGRSGHSR
jgi:hypothetical protein